MEKSSAPLSLPLHRLVQQMQSENGLKHHDHLRYAKFLSRKLSRLRRSLSASSPSSGPASKNKDKETMVKKEEFSVEKVVSEDVLLVPLLCAERAWSVAIAKKDALAKTGKQKLRHSELNRHSKAVTWARTLEFLCLNVPNCDPHTALESSAYANCMEGQYLLEKEQWDDAVLHLSKAKGIYDELCRVGTLDQRDLFTERLNLAVLPSLRFCRYNLSGGRGEQAGDDHDNSDMTASLANDPDLMAKLQHIRSRRRADSDVITPSGNEPVVDGSGGEAAGLASGRVRWCGQRIAVSGEELKPCLLEVETAVEMLQSSVPNSSQALENCLAALDAAQVRVADVRSSLTRGAAQQKSETSGMMSAMAAKESLQHLQQYLEFRKLTCVSLRNMNLVKECKLAMKNSSGDSKWAHAQELAHLYQQLMQSSGEMLTTVEAATSSARSLGGEEGDGAEDILTLRLRSEQMLCRVARLVALSECYALAPPSCYEQDSDSSNAKSGKVAMLEKASALLELADELMSSTVYDNVDNFAQSMADFESQECQKELQRQQEEASELEKWINGAKLRCLAFASACNVETTTLPTTTDAKSAISSSIIQESAIWQSLPSRLSSENQRDSVHKQPKKAGKVGAACQEDELTVFRIPPSFAPVPCKPIFFDMALNFLDLSSSQSVVGKEIDRRCGVVASGSGGNDGQDSAGSTSLVGAAAQSIYGWWSGGS